MEELIKKIFSLQESKEKLEQTQTKLKDIWAKALIES